MLLLFQHEVVIFSFTYPNFLGVMLQHAPQYQLLATSTTGQAMVVPASSRPQYFLQTAAVGNATNVATSPHPAPPCATTQYPAQPLCAVQADSSAKAMNVSYSAEQTNEQMASQPIDQPQRYPQVSMPQISGVVVQGTYSPHVVSMPHVINSTTVVTSPHPPPYATTQYPAQPVSADCSAKAMNISYSAEQKHEEMASLYEREPEDDYDDSTPLI